MAKFKRIDTGEIVNIVFWGANGTFTNYYDSQGKFQHTDLNRYNYFEEIIESSQSGIDWEQRRYEIAKDMLCAIYMDDGNEKRSDCLGKKIEYQSLEGSAREAVRYANVLIEELKKYDNG
jgi:hypothetical protein